MMNTNDKTVKILHFSSRYEECGIAVYLAQHINGMVDARGIHNEYFDISPYRTHAMSPAELTHMADKLRAQLKDYDILHVQFEFALYAHDSFKRIMEAGKRAGKKVVVTVHTSPVNTAPVKNRISMAWGRIAGLCLCAISNAIACFWTLIFSRF
jgi:hypothetical protein